MPLSCFNFKKKIIIACWLFLGLVTNQSTAQTASGKRVEWWRDARFGLFIHWGLYSVPAGEWNGQTNHAEWIRTTANIPLETYDQLLPKFNPTKFDAQAWVRMAKEAGMKYIVITSKHHDGFALFDSKVSDFDIMATPFKRDILKELAEACRKEGITLCFYHSIMDWHHPDYLPRREWEKNRPSEAANFENYISYLKSQLKELTTNYGKIGVLWFDGEWEKTWTHERGKDLYNYVRTLQPSIIINNRVDIGRHGMQGFTKSSEYMGDFGTPEQEIPATGVPGVDWESCMTMNDHWGYNSHDNNWKSSQDLVRKLIDIASKGGNFLLNVGPTQEGLFPDASVQRLKEIGSWMKLNSESIYGSSSSPFKNLSWGRCTQKPISGGTRLYLHVFNWPQDGKLIIPGLANDVNKTYALSGKTGLSAVRSGTDYIVDISKLKQDEFATVVVMDIKSQPVVYTEPEIKTAAATFTDQLVVRIPSTVKEAQIHYTTDGTDPVISSPKIADSIVIRKSSTVKARYFRNGKHVSGITTASFEKVMPLPSLNIAGVEPGITGSLYFGKWTQLPDFLNISRASGMAMKGFDIGPEKARENFGYVFEGLINIPREGVYKFYLSSDDGSRLELNEKLVIDNDGLHSALEKSVELPLAKGYHSLRLSYFQATGGQSLELFWEGPGFERTAVPASALFSAK
jgi:alpha-L-fucosidase